MKARAIFAKAPSWIKAVLLLLFSVIILGITDTMWTPRTETGLISHLINDLIIAFGCFFIVRSNPKSVWYVPIICNALFILSSLEEPGFWKSSMVVPICGGWALSVIVSIIAAQQGKRKQNIR